MSDQTVKVIAHAPGTPGQFSDLAAHLKEITGATCVALVVVEAARDGGYSIAGPLGAQLNVPTMLEQVAGQLRSQLASSVH